MSFESADSRHDAALLRRSENDRLVGAWEREMYDTRGRQTWEQMHETPKMWCTSATESLARTPSAGVGDAAARSAATVGGAVAAAATAAVAGCSGLSPL